MGFGPVASRGKCFPNACLRVIGAVVGAQSSAVGEGLRKEPTVLVVDQDSATRRPVDAQAEVLSRRAKLTLACVATARLAEGAWRRRRGLCAGVTSAASLLHGESPYGDAIGSKVWRLAPAS